MDGGGDVRTPRPSYEKGVELESKLEIKNFGFGRHVNQVRPAVQDHIGMKLSFIKVSVVGAGSADSDPDLIFHQIRKIIINAVTGNRFHAAIKTFYGPVDSAVDEEKVYMVPLGMGDLGKLKTSGCFFVVIVMQHKQETGHSSFSLL